MVRLVETIVNPVGEAEGVLAEDVVQVAEEDAEMVVERKLPLSMRAVITDPVVVKEEIMYAIAVIRLATMPMPARQGISKADTMGEKA